MTVALATVWRVPLPSRLSAAIEARGICELHKNCAHSERAYLNNLLRGLYSSTCARTSHRINDKALVSDKTTDNCQLNKTQEQLGSRIYCMQQ